MDKSGIPAESKALVLDAIAKAQRKGVAKADTKSILTAVGKQFLSGRPPRDVAAYTYAIAESLTSAVQHASLSAPVSGAELAAWEGRCFCWPAGAPTNFIQILPDGQFTQRVVGEDYAKPRYGRLGQSPLLEALRAGELREVSIDVFASLTKSAQP